METPKPIHFPCPCGRRLQVARALAGRRVRCPACRLVIWAPRVDSGFAKKAPVVEEKVPATALSRVASAIAVAGLCLWAGSVALAWATPGYGRRPAAGFAAVVALLVMLAAIFSGRERSSRSAIIRPRP